MHYFRPEVAVGFSPEFHGICGGKRPLGVFSAHVAHHLDAKQLNYQPKGIVQGRRGFIQVKYNPF